MAPQSSVNAECSMDRIARVMVLQTERLVLRRVTVDDAEFILVLLNEPSWLRFIGDKGVRTVDDARAYILKGPVAMYDRTGFGLYLTELKETRTPLGLCGLIKRDGIDDVDIGFAFLPIFWGKGYGVESASAVMAYGKNVLGIQRIVAITSADNYASIRLCENLGLKFERMIRLPKDDAEIKLYA
jgi:RimJ/RimL family protein N-acetyltransferase